MSKTIEYATPMEVGSKDECDWYHTMELPGHGVIEAGWDFRGQDSNLFVNTDFKEKSVLEIGPASGFIGFRMEQLGGEVTSVELPKGSSWDVVPFAGENMQRYLDTRDHHIDRIKKGYWFSHAALQSKNKVISASAYDVPPEAGPFDISVFGSVLTHMQNPFSALTHILKFTRERVIIIEQRPPDWTPQTPGAYMLFQPDVSNKDFYDTWWTFHPTTLVKMIMILGFGNPIIQIHDQMCGDALVPLVTIVADRIVPMD